MIVYDWHITLGHPSITTMKHFGMVDSRMLAEAAQVIESFEICVKAKQTRDPFPVLNRRSTELFDMVDADLWWPFGQENICSVRCMLTLVEDHIRMIWTYMLSSKDQVPETLRKFVDMMKTQFHVDIKKFKTNHGTEFMNHTVQHLFAEYGIIHKKSCVYSPQQNGVVER